MDRIEEQTGRYALYMYLHGNLTVIMFLSSNDLLQSKQLRPRFKRVHARFASLTSKSHSLIDYRHHTTRIDQTEHSQN
jgi:hypothetical protein